MSAPTRPRRDAVDARVVGEVEARAGRIIDSQRDVGGWPAYASVSGPRRRGRGRHAGRLGARARARPGRSQATARAPAATAGTNLELYLNELAGAPAESR